LKYREENVNDIKDDKEKIKENMKKLKEKLIQRINQVEKELTNKLDILWYKLGLFFFKCLVGYGVVNYLVNCNVSK
jgi:hypothetical protein